MYYELDNDTYSAMKPASIFIHEKQMRRAAELCLKNKPVLEDEHCYINEHGFCNREDGKIYIDRLRSDRYFIQRGCRYKPEYET